MSVASMMARLGMDTTGFTSGLKAAEQQATGAHGRMAEIVNRNTSAHDNLLKSNARVANQIHRFTADLTSGASASDLFSSGLQGLGHSLNLSLGALAGLGIGAVFFQSVGSAILKSKELQKEIAKFKAEAAAGDANYESLNVIEARLAGIKQRLEEIKKINWLDRTLQVFGGAIGQSLGAANPFGDQGKADALDARASARTEAAEKIHQQNNLEIVRATEGEPAAKRLALKQNYLEESGAARKEGDFEKVGALLEKFAIAVAVLEKNIRAPQLDRTLLTLGQVANQGDDYTGLTNSQAEARQRSRQQARDVLAFQAEGDRLRDRGDASGAAVNYSHADEIRKGIGGIKGTERNLKDEINASDVPGLLRDLILKTGQPVNI